MDHKEEIFAKIISIFQDYGLTFKEAKEISKELTYTRLEELMVNVRV